MPDDRTYTSGLVLVFDRQSDQDRAWIPGQGGVPSAGAARFGAVHGYEGAPLPSPELPVGGHLRPRGRTG